MFNGKANEADDIMFMSDFLQDTRFKAVYWTNIGKSAAIRIEVPPLKVKEPFENTPTEDIITCFEAIYKLSKFTLMLKRAQKLGKVK